MGLLLDTCALIYLTNGDPIPAAALRAVEQAEDEDSLFASIVSVWEIGLLAKAERGIAKAFVPDPRSYALEAISQPSLRRAPYTPQLAFDASFLPLPFHNDPADRLLVETARVLRVPILTRDRKILDYAKLGHVEAIAC
ncbi:MAG: type II toxin-antitoxin system VapC family toxin [Alphaproteobacteria bacterium]|nr:type II toxin-antitoxin system VapC family toxin [Alphaproteobacteria bacterium]